MQNLEKFWNVVKKSEKCYSIDLFGMVGGSKTGSFFFEPDGFNENEFLDEFRQIPADSEIELSINSMGGSVFTALSIYSILSEHKALITIRVNGAAMSAATIITSVPNAKVIMPRGSMMMIHCVSSVASGSADDLKKSAETTQKIEDNLVQIYANKTGRDEKEIRKAVESETYFTAQEAVDFGLADEVDEKALVTNSINDGVISVNGLAVPAPFAAHIPDRFFAAVTKVSAALESKEDPHMDLEKLKADYPDLVQQIRQEAIAEGRKAECERINAIEDLAIPGFADLVKKAKLDHTVTPEAFAVQLVKAQKAIQAKVANDVAEDAKGLEGILDTGNTGVVDQMQAENDAELEAAIEAGKRGFKNRK